MVVKPKIVQIGELLVMVILLKKRPIKQLLAMYKVVTTVVNKNTNMQKLYKH